ncbi:MAG: putative kinase [Candidatus Methanolliviera sp. GoM_oil]|nr:MAG: putative kinase [Candidatus Methanolliviera sp. GoM_oil]
MLVAITGTPGTGKTSVSELMEAEYSVIHINELVKKKEFNIGTDEERDCLIADTDKLTEHIHSLHKNMRDGEVMIVESHLSHLLDPDLTIVLKTDTAVLIDRLKTKGFGKSKIDENIEAEIMDVILVESTEVCKEVKVIDTTKRPPEDVYRSIRTIICR